MLVERPGGGGPHRRVRVGEPLQQEHGRPEADGLRQRHHGHAPDAGIGIGAAFGQILEIVVEGVEYGHGRPQRRR
jgi:hypothetical protein